MATLIPDWATAHAYVIDESIYTSDDPSISKQYHYKFYRAISAHTSSSFGTDWGNGKWEELTVKGIKGDTGDKGTKGDTGSTGSTGSQGPTGAAGSDGIFSAIASQAEAQAGTENTKGMTALRTKEAIVAQVPSLSAITDLEAEQVVQDGFISDHESRINILEGLSPLSRARGQQGCLNNQAAPVELTGALGNALTLDADGADSARVEVVIFRGDDAETRFTTLMLRMQFVSGVWYLGRESTTDLVGNNPDGVIFTVQTVGNTGHVYYTSDNMVGGNYQVGSYIRWFIEEISNNF